MERIEKGRQEEQRWEKTRKSRFSKWYGEVKRRKILAYLKKGWAEKRRECVGLAWEMFRMR